MRAGGAPLIAKEIFDCPNYLTAIFSHIVSTTEGVNGHFIHYTSGDTTHDARKSGDVPMEHHGFRGAVKLHRLGSGHKDPLVHRPLQGDYSAQDVHCREHKVFL